MSGLFQKKKFAELRQKAGQWTRDFFTRRDYLEVSTPSLVRYGTAEAYIDPVESHLATDRGRVHAGQFIPSPEIHHKKILAAGYEKIFELARVWRNGESFSSPTHNPEFTLLEWYRTGADYRDIMGEVEELVRELLEKTLREAGFEAVATSPNPWPRMRVVDAFKTFAGIDISGTFPDEKDPEKYWRPLISLAEKKGYGKGLSLDDAFYLIVLNEIEPELRKMPAVFLCDYPYFQAAFSRASADGRYGERFELYARGLELANGYSELTDPVEQKKRFEEGNAIRKSRAKAPGAIDPDFLEGLSRIPKTGGVALGFDRLLMLLSGSEKIGDVILFPARDVFGGE